MEISRPAVSMMSADQESCSCCVIRSAVLFSSSAFPARANTGDPTSPFEACPRIRSHARMRRERCLCIGLRKKLGIALPQMVLGASRLAILAEKWIGLR